MTKTPDSANQSAIDLATVARHIRAAVVRMSHDGQAPHLGSSLSCVDLLVAAYWGVLTIDPRRPADPDRDRFILSKGHAAPALYATLAHRGFFAIEDLQSFNQPGSRFPEQPSPGAVPGIEAATGSLGHGLSLGLGMALASRVQQSWRAGDVSPLIKPEESGASQPPLAKSQQRSFRVLVVVSDGECNEGTVWEAAMFAAAQQLDNVTVLVDYNRWQATGRSNQIMALDPLVEKWQAFGWAAREVNGHDIPAVTELLAAAPLASGKPTAIVARTIKGRGVSFMEDDNNWHYRIPNDEELRAALAELGGDGDA